MPRCYAGPSPAPTPAPTPQPTPTPTPSPKSSLWVRLALTPEAASNETGQLHLQGANGFTQTLPISTGFHANPNDDTIDIEFTEVPTKDNYTLSYVAADGTETVLVPSTPFENLQDTSMSDGTPTPPP